MSTLNYRWGKASSILIAMICMIFLEVHLMILRTKYLGSKTCGLKQENFDMCSYVTSCEIKIPLDCGIFDPIDII